MNITTEFAYWEEDELRPIPGVQGIHQLAFRVLRMYLKKYGYNDTEQERAEFVMNLVDERGTPGAYKESLDQIAQLIYYTYGLKKNMGRSPLSSRQRNSVIFVFKTTLLIALERCK